MIVSKVDIWSAWGLGGFQGDGRWYPGNTVLLPPSAGVMLQDGNVNKNPTMTLDYKENQITWDIAAIHKISSALHEPTNHLDQMGKVFITLIKYNHPVHKTVAKLLDTKLQIRRQNYFGVVYLYTHYLSFDMGPLMITWIKRCRYYSPGYGIYRLSILKIITEKLDKLVNATSGYLKVEISFLRKVRGCREQPYITELSV